MEPNSVFVEAASFRALRRTHRDLSTLCARFGDDVGFPSMLGPPFPKSTTCPSGGEQHACCLALRLIG